MLLAPRRHFLLALLWPTGKALSATRPKGIDMKFEGGSLPLATSGLKVYPGQKELVIVQGKQKFAIPAAAITEVSYGNDVHRRVGAAIGVALFTFGVGALLALAKTKKHYVGITWDKVEIPDHSKGGVVFKVGKGEYRGFITALEGTTGKKAVNADKAANETK